MLIGGFAVTNRSNGLRTLPGTLGHFRHYWWANDVDALNNNASIALNQWFMISASYDGITRKIIVNTIEVASDTPPPVLNVSSANINVAADLPGSSEFLQGDIAIACFYNRALPLPDIKQNFDANRARFGL